MKNLKIAILSFLALGATVLNGLSQGVPPTGTYSVQSISLPYTNISAATPGTAGTSTNLGLGWSTVVSVTNTSTTWNSSSNAFISTTNVLSATNTTYADMSIINQKDLCVAVGQSTGATSTNRVITFARLLDSGTVDTINTFSWAINVPPSTTSVATTNIPATWIGGAGGVRIITDLWRDTNAITLTNNFIKFGHKTFAF